MKRKMLILAAGMFAVASTQAETTSSTFTVTMTVLSTCAAAATPLNFGTTPGAIDTSIDASSTISVTCTNGTPYELGLSAGSGDGADYNTRKLSNGSDGSSQADYSIYTDETYSTVWNETDQQVSGIGNGDAEAITVYGRVFGGQNVPQGVYTDTIVATVTF